MTVHSTNHLLGRPGVDVLAGKTGFIHAAGRSLRLSEKKSLRLLEELCVDLPATVEALLPQNTIA